MKFPPVQELFCRQAEQHPERVALDRGDVQISYGALEARSNRLANMILAQGLIKGSIIGIMGDDSIEIITAVIATLKAGCAYVPLEPWQPQARLQAMLDEVEPALMLAEERYLNALAELRPTATLTLGTNSSAEEGREPAAYLDGYLGYADTRPCLDLEDDDLIYIYFTSGSTGRPKGIAGRLKSLPHFILWEIETFGLDHQCRVSQLTAFGFDAFLRDVFTPLCAGGTICIPKGRETVLDPTQLVRWLDRQGVTLVHTVPSIFRALLNEGLTGTLFPALKYILLSGEPMLPSDVGTWVDVFGDRIQLVNFYGASETTMIKFFYRVSASDCHRATIPIGTPMKGARALIVDEEGAPCPPGAVGEIYVRTPYRSLGYYKRPDLTDEVFIPNPFVPDPKPDDLIYKTGDVGRILENGDFEMLGRRDNLVKIRGVRVELGEIENALAGHDAVKFAAAMVREDVPGNPRLVAYLVMAAGREMTPEAWRSFLASKLTDVMIPSAYVTLNKLPRTPTGKLDRKALPAPALAHAGEFVAPRNEVETKLASIWSRILKRDKIGVYDNFFQLGGHSLVATQVISRIRDAFDVSLSLHVMFEAPTLEKLAERIGEALPYAQPESLPITRVSRDGDLPLSFSQQRLWFLDRLDGGSTAYNIPIVLKMSGDLRIDILGASLERILSRHEILRTSFPMRNGAPIQSIDENRSLNMKLVDLQHLSGASLEREIQRRLDEEAARPFDLAAGPLLRVNLLRCDAKSHIAMLTMHHIITDGWSIGVLLREFAAGYTALALDRPIDLQELPFQYVDFAHWQRSWLTGEVLENQMAFWQQQLQAAPTVLNLPADHPRPKVQNYRGDRYAFAIEAPLAEELNRLAGSHQATLFMLLEAAFSIPLSRYADQEQVLIGTPVANRNRKDIEELIGFFVNTLVLRNDLSGDPTFIDYLSRIRQVALEAYDHQDLPFEQLVELIQPERSQNHAPLTQVLFVLHNLPMDDMELPGLYLSRIRQDRVTAKFDLTLSIGAETEGLFGTIEYAEMFKPATIARLADHYRNLLRAIVASPRERVSRLTMIDAAERRELLETWNGHLDLTAPTRCLHMLFERVAEDRSEAKALSMTDGSETLAMTYGELNARANLLAGALIARGIGPEIPVALCMERTPQMVVAILAVLKAGGCYLPLDPHAPPERNALILDDAQPRILLTHEACRDRVPANTTAELAGYENLVPLEIPGSVPNLEISIEAEASAYIIYTSGSTGRPKGVVVSHANVVRLFDATHDWFSFDHNDVWTLFHGYAFDFSVWEIWGALLHGGRLVVVPYWLSRSPQAFADLLIGEGVTVLNQTPSAFYALVQATETVASFPDLRLVIFGGEALDMARLRPWFGRYGDRKPGLVNMYGITETSVHVTYRPVDLTDIDRGRSMIGKPIGDLRVYLADRYLQPVPKGVPGEILVGGLGCARGYLNRPELTAQRFVPDPYSGAPGSRLYRSGDLARFRDGGDRDYLGRIDFQVKIRGFRIELGDIESALAGLAEVREALVLLREGESGDKQLIAYLVPDAATAGAAVEDLIAAVRAGATALLPVYMVPSAFVVLEALPLTVNGKIDRKALPEPGLPASDAEYQPPRTPVEEALAGIWRDVLKREQVGIDDDFFHLGGHSLLAAQMVARIKETFSDHSQGNGEADHKDTINLPLRQVFERPTIAGLASLVEELLASASHQQRPRLAPVSRAERIPLSFAQQRLWFIDQMNPGDPAYNILIIERLATAIDGNLFGRALAEVIRRHEVLRTCFPDDGGTPYQQIQPFTRVDLPFTNLSGLAPEKQKRLVGGLIEEQATHRFTLAHGPLFRCHLVRLDERDHLLLFNLHHAITDGWSMHLLYREVTALYNAFVAGEPSPLADLPIQYADYSHWQRNWLSGPVLAEQLDFWRLSLQGAPPTLDLPSDRPASAQLSSHGANYRFHLPAELAAKLAALARDQSITPFMLYLTAFYLLLYKYSRQQDIVAGVPIAGRSHLETERLIGLFVNTLALRCRLEGNGSFLELLGQVREVALAGYAHQDLPFEKLVDELDPSRDLSRTPLFQVMFNFMEPGGEAKAFGTDTGAALADGPGFAFGDHTQTAKFDLTLTGINHSPAPAFIINYRTALFDAVTVRRMAHHFQTLLAEAAALPERKIEDFTLLDPRERESLLHAWHDNRLAFPAQRCLHQEIEERAARTPDAQALMQGDQVLNYRELNEAAGRLAHELLGHGAAPETIVGVCSRRATEMVVSLLAVLKSGAAYLPLDPDLPPERLAFLLQETRAPLILCQTAHLEKFAEFSGMVVCTDAPDSLNDSRPGTYPAVRCHAENPAYIIFTSGSTGRPKGVQICHRNVLAVSVGYLHQTALSPADRVLQFASFTFDVSVMEIFATLCAGATLVLRGEEMYAPRVLMAAAGAWNISVLSLPTAVWHELALALDNGDTAMPENIRLTVIAGEAALPDRLAAWQRSVPFDHVLLNLYGPTETTVYASGCRLPARPEEGTTVTIGAPLPNARSYIADTRLQLVPVGVAGELLIGGPGLARGYLNQADLTAAAFVPDPFGAVPGARLYRSGDRVRYRADENGKPQAIDFIGRMDFQVKLRGFRIELGEIESLLRRHPLVRHCVVVPREERAGDKQLVAYAQASQEPPFGQQAKQNEAELKQYLGESLPGYMIPARILFLKALPLNTSGKIDRAALPAPARADSASEEDARPVTPVQEILSGIWRTVLQREDIGIFTSFFELGGHSLLATRLVFRMREAFNMDFPVRVIFEKPTIADLALVIENRVRKGHRAEQPPIVAVSREQRLPLSFAQQRLWFIDQLEPGDPGYNVTSVDHIGSDLEIATFNLTVNLLVERHEILRTSFLTEAGQPYQKIMPYVPLSVPFEDLSQLAEVPRRERISSVIGEIGEHRFDLASGPLFLFRLIRLDGNSHLLVSNLHHIITDAWSMNILGREIGAIYKALAAGQDPKLAPLPLQYADFASWQRGWLQGEVLDAQLAYWRTKLAGATQVLDLPTDRPRPQVIGNRGANHYFSLPPDLYRRLLDLCRQQECTPFMLFLAAFHILLARFARSRDFNIGVPVTGRNHTASEGLLGLFVNTLVLRIDSGDRNLDFAGLIRQIRETTLSAYAQQDLPFEKLVETLDTSRDLSHTPLFQVMFNFLEAEAEPAETEAVLGEAPAVGGCRAQFDISLTGVNYPSTPRFILNYRTELFNAATMSRLADHFEHLLSEIATQSQRPVDRLDLLSAEEKNRLISLGQVGEPQREAGTDVCTCFALLAARRGTASAAVLVGEASGGESEPSAELSYTTLDHLTNQLAHYLSSRGVRRESRVALCLERNLDMVVAIIAVLKSGGVFLPVASDLPRERKRLLLEDARPTVVLTHSRFRGELEESGLPVIEIDGLTKGGRSGADTPTILEQNSDTPAVRPAADNAAYMIYTSGSTGTPKGVVVSHRALVDHCTHLAKRFQFDENSRILLFSSFSFDPAVEHLFLALLIGATVIVRGEELWSAERCTRVLRQQAIDSADLPTAYWRELVRSWHKSPSLHLEGMKLKYLMAGGEAMPAAEVALWQAMNLPAVRLFNTYGPTETTVTATYYEIQREVAVPRVPLGRATANRCAFVLDENLQPLPPGFPGELLLGGTGLARGYHDRPAQTAEKFVPNPFAEIPGDRLYRTGDLVRCQPDGTLDFLGRVDFQVKLRGFRIELGEIEAHLATSPHVKAATVVVSEQGGHSQLAAYLIPVRETTDEAERMTLVDAIREDLTKRIPAYMIPTSFSLLDSFPLTAGGKVDRGRLPAPSRLAPTSKIVAPRDDLERQLLHAFEEALSLHPLGIEGHFFELGGHSLLAVPLVHTINSFTSPPLSLVDLFQNPTVAGLAALIRARTGSAPAPNAIVTLREGSDRPALFWVHPVGGGVLCYEPLARALPPQQPFHAFPSRGIENDVTPLQSIEDMAATYIEALLEAQSRGPFLLGGWSMGGAVAYEMACRLRHQGHQVAGLFMVDTHLAETGSALPGETELLVQFSSGLGVPLTFDKLARLDTDQALSLILQKIACLSRQAGNITPHILYRHFAVFRANSLALLSYEPGPYPGRAVLCTTRSSNKASRTVFTNLAADMETFLLPGDHYSIMESPHVSRLAEVLTAWLNVPEAALVQSPSASKA